MKYINSLDKLKKEFKNSSISKPEYIKKMHKLHRRLFEYAQFIQKTDVDKIEITDNKVVMTLRKTGLKFFCDIQDQRIAPIEILNFDHYEGAEFEIALKIINDEETVFDIGANIGWYSLTLAKLLPKIKIFAFEPIPKTFNYLKKNIELNGTQNIKAFNCGFSNKSGQPAFYYYPEGSGNASLVNLSHRKNIQKVRCNLRTIDGFVRKKKLAVDFIKCDVEGAELLVFQGALETLKRDKPIIFVEMLRKWSKGFGYHPNEIVQLLKSLDYRCFIVNDSRLDEVTEITDKTSETNFFFLHRKKHRLKIKKFIGWN